MSTSRTQCPILQTPSRSQPTTHKTQHQSTPNPTSMARTECHLARHHYQWSTGSIPGTTPAIVLHPTQYWMGAALLRKNLSTMGLIPNYQQQLHNQWRHLLHQHYHHGVTIHTRLLEALQHHPTPPNGHSARDANTTSTSATDTRHSMQWSSASTHSPTTPARKPDDETHPPTTQMGPKRKNTPRLIPHHCA